MRAWTGIKYCYSKLKHKGLFICDELLSFFEIVISFFSAKIITQIIVFLSDVGRRTSIIEQGLLLLLLFATTFYFKSLKFRLRLKYEKETRIEIKKEIVNALLKGRINLDSLSSSAVLQEILCNDCNKTVSYLQNCVLVIGSFITVIVSGIILSHVSFWAVMILTFVLTLLSYLTLRKSKEVRSLSERLIGKNDYLNKLTRDIVTQTRQILFVDASTYFFDKYNEQIEECKQASIKRDKVSFSVSLWSDFYDKTWIVLMLFGAYFLYSFRNISLTGVAVLFAYSKLFCGGFTGIIRQCTYIQQDIVSIERVSNITSSYISEKGEKTRLFEIIHPERIIVKNVSFGYDSEHPVFDGLNLIFEKGLNVITGSNGKGKTTLLNLVQGYLNPDRGSIFAQNSEKELFAINGEMVAYYSQGAELFHIPLRDNIICCESLRKKTDDEILDKFFRVGLDIDDIEQQLGRDVSEKRNYSCGQQKKILFSRILLIDKPIYLFDEPLAGLDIIAKQKVCEEINKLANDKLVIVVTHETDGFKYDRIFSL